jgi:hypothetical protein
MQRRFTSIFRNNPSKPLTHLTTTNTHFPRLVTPSEIPRRYSRSLRGNHELRASKCLTVLMNSGTFMIDGTEMQGALSRRHVIRHDPSSRSLPTRPASRSGPPGFANPHHCLTLDGAPNHGRISSSCGSPRWLQALFRGRVPWRPCFSTQSTGAASRSWTTCEQSRWDLIRGCREGRQEVLGRA